MKQLIFALITFAAIYSHAHFKIGTYKGYFMDGTECSFEIKSVSFENNMRHPLNERVDMFVNFDNKQITTKHLAIADAVTGTVRPKEGVLSAVNPLTTGAEVYELFMNDEGPVQFVYYADHYKSPDKNVRKTCMNLEYVQP